MGVRGVTLDGKMSHSSPLYFTFTHYNYLNFWRSASYEYRPGFVRSNVSYLILNFLSHYSLAISTLPTSCYSFYPYRTFAMPMHGILYTPCGFVGCLQMVIGERPLCDYCPLRLCPAHRRPEGHTCLPVPVSPPSTLFKKVALIVKWVLGANVSEPHLATRYIC